MRPFALGALACLLIAALIVLTRDPEEPWAVALFVLAVGGAAAAFATWVLTRRRSRRRVAPEIAGRRGMEVGAIVVLLLWLRAIDGLSFVTAAFVVGTFVVAELVLAARPRSSR